MPELSNFGENYGTNCSKYTPAQMQINVIIMYLKFENL